MDIEVLTTIFPRLYHMAEAGSWDSMKEHGLLSTSAILDTLGIFGAEREAIESQRRPSSVSFPGSNMVIRDQGPMSDTLVAKSLQGTGLKPSDWYRLLNSMVFFFVREEGLRKLLNAKNYRDQEHDVLTLNTASLIEAHYGSVRLCPINSGATFLTPQPRSADSFMPIGAYPFDEIARRRRSRTKAIAECCVIGAVPDIEAHTLSVFRMKGSEPVFQIL